MAAKLINNNTATDINTTSMLTLFVGQKLHVLEEIPSTNAYVKQCIQQNSVVEGFTARAKHQTLGRGQFGNTWHDEPGKNLLFSVYLRPHFLQAPTVYNLNVSVCLALVKVLNSYKNGFTIKWPNDILFEQRKICGVLIENTISNKRVEHCVVGVGLNVNQRYFPNLPGSTSLIQILDEETNITTLFEKLLKAIEVAYMRMPAHFAEQKAQFLKQLYGTETPVTVLHEGTEKQMLVKGITSNGQLLALIEGQEYYFNFKEIEFKL